MKRTNKRFTVFAGGFVLLAVLTLAGHGAAQTVVTVNFDDLDTSSSRVGGAALDAYLATFGITITNVTPTQDPAWLLPGVDPDAVSGFPVPPASQNILAPSSPNYLEGPFGSSVSHTLEFAIPLDSFSFTRAGMCTGFTAPLWNGMAKDISGTVIATVGEPDIPISHSCLVPFPAAVFTIATPGIKSFTLDSGSRSFLGRPGPGVDDLVLTYPPVDIDIKPGSDPNSINPKSKGVIPVAILGSDTFDVTDVDVTTLEFGPVGATPAHDLTDPIVYADHLQDVNGDGYTDLVSHYRTQDTGIAKGDTQACIGVPIILSCDAIRTVGK